MMRQNLAEKLENDVRYLSDTIGERNMYTPGTMEATADWIHSRFEAIGYHPGRQDYHVKEMGFRSQTAENIIAGLKGKENPEQVLVIGAHYDTVPGSPGANDNSSALAVLFALAEWFKDNPPSKTIRFIAFANEEPPFFQTGDMGSYACARKMYEKGEHIEAMIAMDGVGYFSDKAGSQKYPLPGLGFFYPKTANFIGFVTRTRDRGLLKKCLKAFRKEAEIRAEGAALPGGIPGTSWSDHWSFWQFDYPALLVTDTLPFRDPYYHTPGDTAERLDYNRTALVAEGLKNVIVRLAFES